LDFCGFQGLFEKPQKTITT